MPLRRARSHLLRQDCGVIPIEEYLAVSGRRVQVEHAGARNGALVQRLVQLAAWIVPVAATREGEWLAFGASLGYGRVAFCGAVEGRLREPLVELLRAAATGAPEYDGPATPALAREVAGERALDLYVSASCPFCPAAVATVGRVVLARPDFSVHVRRVDDGCGAPPEVRALPTLLARGRAVSGPVSEPALLRFLE